MNKESAYNAGNAGDMSLIPGLGRSPGEENGNPLQYSCLENSMETGAWQATVHGLQRVGHDYVAISISIGVQGRRDLPRRDENFRR